MASYIVTPPLYIVEVRDQYGRLIVILARPQQKQFSLYRNKPGSLQFVMDLYDPQALPQYLVNSVNDIIFRRNGVPVIAGQLTYHEPKIDDSDSQKEVDVTATGYFDQLDYRIITNDYPGFDAIHNKLPFAPTDVGQIAWTLIDYAQFPVPNADDITANTVELNGTFSVQQSFVAQGSALLKMLKFVIQNGSIYTGNVSSATVSTLTDTSANFPSLVGGSVTITNGTDSGDIQIIASNTSNTITLYGNNLIFNGTATSATTNTLTDTGQPWGVSPIIGGTISITGGTDAGDSLIIIGVTSDQITVAGDWQTIPDNTSTYSIQTSICNGIASAATSSTLTDSTQNWLPNAFAGLTVSITAGTDNEDAAAIISNTATQLIIEGEWVVQPDITSTYSITPQLTGNWSLAPDTTSSYSITPLIPTTTGNLIVKLINDANGLPNGSIVPNSTLTIPMSSIPNTLGWFEIDYSSTPGVSLTQGVPYWLSLNLDTVQQPGNGLVVQYLTTAYYPFGRSYSKENPNLFSLDSDLQFFVLETDNSYQMTKNTYMSIQQGTIQPSFRLAPTFDQYKHIKAAIEDLSTTYNGMDFAINVVIDPNTNIMTKFFNVYYPGIGQQNTSLNFSYPGNIKKMEKPKDGTAMYNEVYMRGQGSGTAQIVDVERDNSSIYTYGVRQVDESQPDVSDLPTLTSLAQEFIRINSLPSDLPAMYLDGNLPPALGAYGIGDWILINMNDPRSPILNFTQQYRIEEIDVTIDDDGVEEIQVNGANV